MYLLTLPLSHAFSHAIFSVPCSFCINASVRWTQLIYCRPILPIKLYLEIDVTTSRSVKSLSRCMCFLVSVTRDRGHWAQMHSVQLPWVEYASTTDRIEEVCRWFNLYCIVRVFVTYNKFIWLKNYCRFLFIVKTKKYNLK